MSYAHPPRVDGSSVANALSWMGRAACRGRDLSIFFGVEGERGPDKEVRELKAKRICLSCPVKDICLDYALDSPQKGVWGGLNEEERFNRRRQTMRRRRAA